jgi:flagellar protein FliO/FliZ
MNSSTFSVFPSILSLLIVLAFIVSLGWLLKRSKIRLTNASLLIKTIGGLSIGPREKILIIEINDLWYVLGVTASSINLIAQIPKQSLTESNNGISAVNFIASLQERLKK